jgi:intein/homing endonuclease
MAEVFEIELDNGAKLVGTGNHPVSTGRGFVRLDALRYGEECDIIDTCNNLYTRELNTTGLEDTIHQSEDVLMEILDYTKQCGKIPMGRFQRAIKSTIKTETEEIMTSLISKLEKYQNTLATIQEKGGLTKNIETRVLSILKELDTLLKSGMLLQKELSGTENTEKNLGEIESGLLSLVKYVKNLSAHHFLREQYFAVIIVKRRSLGREDVYNLSVYKDHVYYANGILTHNCDALRYVIYMQETGKVGRVAQTFYPGMNQRRKGTYMPQKDKGSSFTHYPNRKR